MKTYKEVVNKPKLVISYDDMMDSPRSWDGNLGYFITVDSNVYSPDRHEQLEFIVKDTGEVAENLEDHKRRIRKAIKEELGEKVIEIYPVYKYEHGSIVYRLGVAHGFDCSNNGFYIITDKTLKENGFVGKKKDFVRIVEAELEDYTKWINGDIYRFLLYDDEGEIVDSCCGFYDLEAIKGELPNEWKDENMEDYFVHQ